MNKEIVENLIKNDYLKEKISIIDKLIEKEDYKEAYFKLAVILEYLNIKYIKHKYNLDMPNSSVINIINTYIDKDNKLYKEMVTINGEYNQVDTNDITMDDIEYLVGMVDSIYMYMLEDLGEFI